MESLSEQLERLGKALKERALKDATSQALKSGSTAGAGKTTMLPDPETVLPPEMLISSLPATLGDAASQVVKSAASGSVKATGSPQNTATPQHSNQDKARLAEALARICALQRQYGKTEAELKVLVEGFCWALSEYHMDSILQAIKQYIKTRPDIPAPADIEAILNPPLPKPDWAVYVALKKRSQEGDWLLASERQFLRDCEEYAKRHHAEEMGNYRTAQRELDTHLRSLPA
jgi:hypothetical protein